MSVGYRAVGWNRQKRRYDAVLAAATLLYLLTFVGVGTLAQGDATFETLLLRALGSGAFLLLHVALAIGPLCRLSPRFLPLLYNRRHLGVTTFLLAAAHGALALVQFHAGGDVHPLVSVLSANPRWDSLAQFPFQPLGLAALGILFLMAATSHDFWLANLGAPVWKALHMLVYPAYALVVLHVVLGTLQSQTDPARSPVLGAALALGSGGVFALHLLAGWRERASDRQRSAPAGSRFVPVCATSDVPDGRARVVTVAGERVAVFRNGETFCALSNACQHQNGPLGEGRILDGCITCPWHGYQYVPETGRSPPPFTEAVPVFEVQIEGGRVWVASQPSAKDVRVQPARLPSAPAVSAPPGGVAADEFYVGWRPSAPPRLGQDSRRLAAGLLVLSLAAGGGLSASHAVLAGGTFEFGRVATFSGTLRERPQPSLLVEHPGGLSRYLLAAEWKRGAAELVAGWDDRRVRLQGTLVHRGDRTLIEVVSGSLEPLAETAPAPPSSVVELGTVTLRGEIVDTKCFLGVMTPGAGKVHRDCAVRCISGGIPPALRVQDAQGRVETLVLLGLDGRMVNAAVLDKVAELVEITGAVERHDDLLVIRADPASIRRVADVGGAIR